MADRILFSKLQKNLLIAVFVVLISILAAPLAPMRPYAAWAGEGGSSTYTPGTNAWSMGVVPPPGLYFRYVFLFCEGRADAVAESGEIQLNAQLQRALYLKGYDILISPTLASIDVRAD